MKLAPVIAMLLIAAPAMAQSTIVLPESGGGGLAEGRERPG
jgi:hypothetical protein